jgi:hypothetical protein
LKLNCYLSKPARFETTWLFITMPCMRYREALISALCIRRTTKLRRWDRKFLKIIITQLHEVGINHRCIPILATIIDNLASQLSNEDRLRGVIDERQRRPTIETSKVQAYWFEFWVFALRPSASSLALPVIIVDLATLECYSGHLTHQICRSFRWVCDAYSSTASSYVNIRSHSTVCVDMNPVVSMMSFSLVR